MRHRKNLDYAARDLKSAHPHCAPYAAGGGGKRVERVRNGTAKKRKEQTKPTEVQGRETRRC